MAVSGVDYMSAPQDYAELFHTYYPYVVNLVNKFGITEDNKEDVASEILTRFMERGFLEKFDPSLTFFYNGEQRPARFKTFLSRFVLTYVQGHYDKQKRIAKRETQLCDVMFRESWGHGAEALRWVDLYGDSHEGHEEAVLDAVREEDLARGLRNYLADIPHRSTGDRCDLVALFDAVRTQCLDKGCYDITALKEQFSVSSTAMHTWIWWLKENIAEALGLPVPPKRRRTARPKP